MSLILFCKNCSSKFDTVKLDTITDKINCPYCGSKQTEER